MEALTEREPSTLRKVGKGLAGHLTDCTAIIAESMPPFAFFETLPQQYYGAGMSPEVSLNTRLLATATAFGGLGYLYAAGRRASRRIFRLTPESSEKSQQIHDVVYTGAFNMVLSPIFYLAAGESDPKKIAIGTAWGAALGAVNGGPMGYAVDVFNDLVGTRPNDRLPHSMEALSQVLKEEKQGILTPVRNYLSNKASALADRARHLRPIVKKGIAGLLVGGSIALTAGVYSLNHNNQAVAHSSPAPVEESH